MVKKDKDASQKSEQGNRGAAGALAEELWPRGAVGRLVRTSLVTWSPFPTWASQLLSPFLPSTLHFPCLGSWSFAQVQGPLR